MNGLARRGLAAAWLGSALAAVAFTSASADPFPTGWQATNMQPVGYSNLQGRDAFKLAIKQVGGRWYLFMGHLWSEGWSVVDVTNPADPKYLKFIPGPANSWTIQVTFHDNLLLTALQTKPPSCGGTARKPGAGAGPDRRRAIPSRTVRRAFTDRRMSARTGR